MYHTPKSSKDSREKEMIAKTVILKELSELNGEDVFDMCHGGIDAVARNAARLLLKVALEIEVSVFLGRLKYQRRKDQRGSRNGKRKRYVNCRCGSIPIAIPKVRDAEDSFEVQSIKAFQRKSDELTELLPILYADGLSTRDFERSLNPFWEEVGLSRSSVSRANKLLYEQFETWRKRDLSEEKVMYLFLDGYYERVRFGSKETEGILVAHAIREDGSRELLAIALGPKESEDAWMDVLSDLKRRGLRDPSLIVSDGAKGLISAVKKIYCKMPRQRCTAHKTRNVLSRVPKKLLKEVEQDLKLLFHSKHLEEAQQKAQYFFDKWGHEIPTACEVLARDLEDCFTFYRFPEEHWKRIRTSNVLERVFKEARRRTQVVGRFPTEKSALVLVWATISRDRIKWNGVKMYPLTLEHVKQSFKSLSEDPIIVKSAKKFLEVA